MSHWGADTQPARTLPPSRNRLGCLLGLLLRLLLLGIFGALLFAFGFALGSDAEFLAPARARVESALAPMATLIAWRPSETPLPFIDETPPPTAQPTPLPKEIPPSATAPPPTNTSTPAPTSSFTPSPTASFTPSPTTTFTSSPTATDTPSPTATVTPSPAPTATPSPTFTPLPTATPLPAPVACFPHERAWVTGAMNVRANPNVNAAVVGAANAGENYAVAESRQGPTYCWLRIETGWMAQTIFVSGSEPAAPAPGAANPSVQAALDRLYALTVAPENRCSHYDSDDYPYPPSVEPRIVDRMGGRIYGPYTGTTFRSIFETDIEHIVAKAEAHDSGLCSANPATRATFARDLLNLTLASPTVNRHQKSAKDFAEWRPPLNVCWYADTIIQVKTKYRLSVDSRERAALETALRNCPSLAMLFTSSAPAASNEAGSAPAQPAQPASGDWRQWDSNNNGRITCAEAREHDIAPVHSDHPAYPYMNDGDGDGVVCE